ncbi:MAG: hypothetical protein JWQ09_1039 [Segetibacter sp.]|nr:hypothetical protein [Segetibacter sp.]
MEKHTKTAHFVGGPLDGQTKQIQSNQTVYKHEQPPVSDDIILGEVPVGFFPPIHEYIYEEKPAGSASFVYIAQHHQ